MRRDIQKVVFERAKAGRTWASKTPRPSRVALTPDGGQFNEDSNIRHVARQKGRNSHLNALERFLVRNVGRPWNKVYAEVCASADARNMLGAEIRDYILGFVATNCSIQARKIMAPDWRGVPGEVRGLFVHPRTGILSRTPKQRSNLS